MSPSPIPYVRAMTPLYGEAETISPLLRRVLAHNPSPFTYLGTNSYIVGHGEVAVIDPGPALPEHVAALEKALEGECISHILVTHTHLDHSPAARLLQKSKLAAGAKIYGYGPHYLSQDAAGEVTMEEGGDHGFSPDIKMRHGDKVKGPDWALEAVYTPGHISNHLCFGLAEEKALVTGDHIMGWATSVIVPPDGNMESYMRSLDLVLARGDEILWPAHGPPVKAPQPFIRALVAHRQMREAEIMAQLQKGQRHIPDMVAVIYAEIDKRLHGAAAKSVRAHLEHMEKKGLVRVEEEKGGGLKRAYVPA